MSHAAQDLRAVLFDPLSSATPEPSLSPSQLPREEFRVHGQAGGESLHNGQKRSAV
jgi:hypothetical protein